MTYRQKRIKVAKRKIKHYSKWLDSISPFESDREEYPREQLNWWEETLERLTTGGPS